MPIYKLRCVSVQGGTALCSPSRANSRHRACLVATWACMHFVPKGQRGSPHCVGVARALGCTGDLQWQKGSRKRPSLCCLLAGLPSPEPEAKPSSNRPARRTTSLTLARSAMNECCHRKLTSTNRTSHLSVQVYRSHIKLFQ